MLVLGLKQQNDGVAYAVVSDEKLLNAGFVTGTDFLEQIETETGLRTGDYDQIATSDSEEIKGLSVKASRYPLAHALTHAIWVNPAELETPFEAPSYPYLLWLEGKDTAALLLVEGIKSLRQVDTFAGGSTRDLEKGFASQFRAGLLESALLGDQQQNRIKHLEAKAEFSAAALLKNIPANADTDTELSRELQAQLAEYAVFDTAAAVLDAWCESIIVRLLDSAYELGVRSLGYSGPLVYNERFRDLIATQTESLNYELRLPPLDHNENSALALAAYASFASEQ